MTTQELHIRLDVFLQKLDSNWNKNIIPQEKDLLLNNEVLRFFKQRLDPISNRKQTGAFGTVKRTQDLNPLLRTKSVDVVYNEEGAFIEFPFDFMHFVSATGNLTCNVEQVNQITSSYYTSIFPPLEDISQITDLGDQYIIEVLIQGIPYTVINIADLPPQYLPQDNIEPYLKRFILINAILVEFKRKRYNNIELKYDNATGNFIVKTDIEHITRITHNVTVSNYFSIETTYNTYNEISQLQCDIRPVDEEFKNHIRRSYLSSSKDESIVAYQREKHLILEIPSGVILNTLNITYFCYPQRIDVLLDSNSELTDTTLEEIAANTAQRIKGIISSDSYNKYVQENILIE